MKKYGIALGILLLGGGIYSAKAIEPQTNQKLVEPFQLHETRSAPMAMKLFGTSFPITNMIIEDTPINWTHVYEFVPERLTQQHEETKTLDELVEYLGYQSSDHAKNYEAAIEKLSKALEDESDQKDPEAREFVLAEHFMADQAPMIAKAFPAHIKLIEDTQKKTYAHLALQILYQNAKAFKDMKEQAQKSKG